MLKKPYVKSIILGLLLILVISAALFFKAKVDPDSGPIDFKEGNYPVVESETAIGSEKSLVGPSEDVPQEMVNDMLDGLKEADRARFQSFLDISQSGKDNDPRIDSELKNLSSELKNQLKKYYRSLAPEKRNERGFVSFLISRDARSVEDLEFIAEVLSEEPCLSMADCKNLSDRDAHMGSVDEVSINYPQLVSLYQLGSKLATGTLDLSISAIKEETRSALAKGARSPVPQIREKAEAIQKKYNL